MSAFETGLAEILEVEPGKIGPTFDLTQHTWDSLAVITTIALIDECFDVMVDGASLAKCKLVSDIQSLIDRAKNS